MKYLAVAAFTIAFFTGCEPAEKSTNPMTRQVAVQPELQPLNTTPTWYSPFVVDVTSDDLVFSHISFKDVGTHLQTMDREPVMETLAESLAMALETDTAFRANWNLRYDAELTQADAHLSCADHHLYVDVWDGDGSWGYSLWSGCGEEDNFAGGDVAIHNKNDVSEHVAPLVKAVTDDIKTAHSTKCFVQKC